MNSQTPFASPVKAIQFRFLVLCVVAMGIAVTSAVGAIDGPAEKRALGLLVGVMTVVIGNFLPKVRPLQLWLADASQAHVAERFAGWTFVLAGSADVVLFAFAPLAQARFLSAWLGIVAILFVAAHWTWTAFRTASVPSHTEPNFPISPRAAQKQRLLASLLLAFLWILASASVTFLFSKQSWFPQFGALWTISGFGLLYAALHTFLHRKRPAPCSLASR